MAARWLFATGALGFAALGAAQIDQLPDGLIVEWRTKTIEIRSRIEKDPDGTERESRWTVLQFADGVTARYGVTTVRAEALELHLDEEDPWGAAHGKVRLEDPEGSIETENLEFRWKSGRASTRNATIQVGMLRVRADRVLVEPGKWTIEGAELNPCHEQDELFALGATRLEIQPGKAAVARGLRIEVFRNRVIVLPKYSVSLNPASRGLRMPTLSYKGNAFGASWLSDYPIGPRTYLSAEALVDPVRSPHYGVFAVHNFLPGREGQSLVEPRSELGEAFRFGYMDNVVVASRAEERRMGGAPKAALSIGTVHNERAGHSFGSERISKPWEAVAEYGGSSGGWAHFLQLRTHRIRDESIGSRTRSIGWLTVIPPEATLGPNLSVFVRADARRYFGDSSDYGWFRGQAGVAWSPSKTFSLTAAFAQASETGEPLFAFDRLEAKKVIALRTDVRLGPRSLSALIKYGLDEGKLVDTEIAFSQVAGCVEPYVAWRESPHLFVFGVRLRALEPFDKFKTGGMKRDRNNRPVPEQSLIGGRM